MKLGFESSVESKEICWDLIAVATKRGKTEEVQSDQDVCPDDIPNNDPSPSSEPDVFRCLSCFSLFIPTGLLNGWVAIGVELRVGKMVERINSLLNTVLFSIFKCKLGY